MKATFEFQFRASLASGIRRSFRLVLGLGLIGFYSTPLPAATRVWTGASATSGNWTTAANWQGNVAPSSGDTLQFVDTGARKTSNTNNYAAGTTFAVINCFGNGYRLRGNRVTVTNSVNVGNPAGSHIIDFDITLGGPETSVSVGVFDATSSLTINGDINLGSRTLLPEQSGDLTIAGVISGTGGVFKNNAGELNYAGLGANTYSGLTTVARGILRLNRYNITGGLDLVGTTAIAGDLSVGDYASTLIGDIVVLDRDNQIANTSTVWVRPTGSLELSNESDTVGELRLSGGTVTTGTGVLGVEGNIYASSPINVSKDSLIAGRFSLGSRGSEPQVIDVASGVQLHISAQVSGVSTADLIKTNRGELILSASNTFSGDVEIHGGLVTISHGSALGSTNGVTRPVLGSLAIAGSIGIPETLEVPGPASAIEVASGSPSWLGPVQLQENLSIYVPTNSYLTIVGQISGPAGWLKYGDGTLQFKTPYTNTYAGTGRVRNGDMILDGVINQPVISGPLIIGNTNDPAGASRVSYIKQRQIGDAVPVTVLKSGVLALQGYSDTIGSLAGTGNVELDSGALIAGGNGDSTSFAGVISGTGSFTKNGAGTMTLTGTNTYSGITTNLGGTLLMNGRLNGSPVVQVRPGSILGGTGVVQGVSVFAGGQVSPGLSPGHLTAGGGVLMSSGTFNVELNGLAAGTGYDRLTVGGTVTLGGALVVNLGFAPNLSDSFMILEKIGAGAITGTFSGLPEGAILNVGATALQITYTGGNGNDVVLTRVPSVAPVISGISAITPEKMQILGQGVPGLSYVLEAAPHLNEPIPWTAIATNAASGAGIYEFIEPYADNGSVLHPQRFFRVRWP